MVRVEEEINKGIIKKFLSRKETIIVEQSREEDIDDTINWEERVRILERHAAEFLDIGGWRLQVLWYVFLNWNC